MTTMRSMASNDNRSRSGAQRAQATLERDIAIARVSRVRGASIAGAAGLTAGFAVLMAGIAPGKTYGATIRAGGALTPLKAAEVGVGVLPQMPPLASASVLGLRAPASLPSAAAGSSGGSGASSASASSSGASGSSGSSTSAAAQQAAAQQAAAQQAAAQQAAAQQAAAQQAAAQQAAAQQAAAQQPVAQGGGGAAVVSGGS